MEVILRDREGLQEMENWFWWEQSLGAGKEGGVMVVEKIVYFLNSLYFIHCFGNNSQI